MASCALPGIFPSAPLLVKAPSGEIKSWHSVDNRWIDGSVENDIPLKKLTEMFNVNHFIVCQVNPHIYPLLSLIPVAKSFGSLYEKLFILTVTEIKHRLRQLSKLGLFRKTCHYLLNVLEQPYQGDITIVPRLAFKDIVRFFTDLEWDGITRALIEGQRATWPQLSYIQNQCRVELTLDNLLCRLKARLTAISGPHQTEGIDLYTSEHNGTYESLFKPKESLLIESLEDIIGDTNSVGSLGDSILIQEDEMKPIEFVKPLYRSASVTYILDDPLQQHNFIPG